MRTQLYARKITIDSPHDSDETWIHVVVEKIERDEVTDKVLNVHVKGEYIHRRLADMGVNIFSFLDPVLSSESSISGYGLGIVIQEAVVQWMAEKLNGTIEDGRVWL